ncbi:hypothetical protein RSAG8_02087, partial [Rhizoctonia solani AG-8 WAC10335]
MQLVQRLLLIVASIRLRCHALLRIHGLLWLVHWLLNNGRLSRIHHPHCILGLMVMGILRDVCLCVRPLHYVLVLFARNVVWGCRGGAGESVGGVCGLSIWVLVILAVSIVRVTVGICGQCVCRRRGMVGICGLRDVRGSRDDLSRMARIGRMVVILMVWVLVRHGCVLSARGGWAWAVQMRL